MLSPAAVARAAVLSPQLACISVSPGDMVFGLDSAGHLLLYAPSTQPWTPLAGDLASVSACSDGSAWGLDASGAPQHCVDAAWRALPSPPTRLVALSAGGAQNVWGVDATGNAYQYDAVHRQW